MYFRCDYVFLELENYTHVPYIENNYAGYTFYIYAGYTFYITS